MSVRGGRGLAGIIFMSSVSTPAVSEDAMTIASGLILGGMMLTFMLLQWFRPEPGGPGDPS